jgi:hypothetical protein
MKLTLVRRSPRLFSKSLRCGGSLVTDRNTAVKHAVLGGLHVVQRMEFLGDPGTVEVLLLRRRMNYLTEDQVVRVDGERIGDSAFEMPGAFRDQGGFTTSAGAGVRPAALNLSALRPLTVPTK